MLVYLFNVLLAVCSIYAFVRGGAPERLVALAFIAAAAATYAVQPVGQTSYRAVELNILSVDAGLLIALVAVALTANRFWPIWIAALQFFALLVHVARACQVDVLPVVYFAVIARIAYPMVIMLALGTMFHFDRLRRHGSDPDWSFAMRRSYHQR
jgi:hypothetical protein